MNYLTHQTKLTFFGQHYLMGQHMQLVMGLISQLHKQVIVLGLSLHQMDANGYMDVVLSQERIVSKIPTVAN